jgi:DnaK suppressor protein
LKDMTHIEGITANGVAKAAPSHGMTATEAHAQAHSARRTDVKAKVGKTKVSAKVQGNAKKAVAKSAVKAGLTAVAKPAAAKSVSKPALKSSAKSSSQKPSPKTSPKSTAKPSAKPAVKTPAKAIKPGASKGSVAKVAAKAPLKAAVNAKPQKPAPKVAAKPAKPVAQKEAPKDLKAKAKVVAAKAPATSQPKAKITSIVPVAVKTPPKPVASVAARAMPAPVVTPLPTPVAASAALVPAKAGRPSSRLAQLTVPSMAQSVASTAAKASFTQTMSLPLIVPPLPSAAKKDPKLANNWKTKPVEQLTDAELMAMPDSEYMNEKQMAVFRLKLSVLKQDILNSAGETTEHLREDTVVVPDPADRATIEEEHALELRTRDRERKLLKKIEQSINRIDAGDYGYCDETGEPIGVGRLLARPTATLSLEAQQRRELKQKMFGD